MYSWIGPPLDAHENQFTSEPNDLQQIQDHAQKTLGKENLDLRGLFLCAPLSPGFFKITFQIKSK